MRDRLTRMLTMQLWEVLEGTHSRSLCRGDKGGVQTILAVSAHVQVCACASVDTLTHHWPDREM